MARVGSHTLDGRGKRRVGGVPGGGWSAGLSVGRGMIGPGLIGRRNGDDAIL
jgi:hypothetical protein